MVHFIGCFYTGIGKYSYYVLELESWIIKEDVINLPWQTQYINSIFYSAALMMGEGVYVLPHTSYETIFYIISMVVTVIITAYIINEMGAIMGNLKKDRQTHIDELAIINQFMEKKQMSLDIQRRTRNYLEYLYDLKHEMTLDEEKDVLNKLSKNLKDEILQKSLIKIINNIAFFQQFSINFATQCAHLLEEQIYSHNEYIVSQKDNLWEQNQSLYYIHRGEVITNFEDSNLNISVYPQQTFGTYNIITGISKQRILRINKKLNTLGQFNDINDFIEKNYQKIMCIFRNTSYFHILEEDDKQSSQNSISQSQSSSVTSSFTSSFSSSRSLQSNNNDSQDFDILQTNQIQKNHKNKNKKMKNQTPDSQSQVDSQVSDQELNDTYKIKNNDNNQDIAESLQSLVKCKRVDKRKQNRINLLLMQQNRKNFRNSKFTGLDYILSDVSENIENNQIYVYQKQIKCNETQNKKLNKNDSKIELNINKISGDLSNILDFPIQKSNRNSRCSNSLKVKNYGISNNNLQLSKQKIDSKKSTFINSKNSLKNSSKNQITIQPKKSILETLQFGLLNNKNTNNRNSVMDILQQNRNSKFNNTLLPNHHKQRGGFIQDLLSHVADVHQEDNKFSLIDNFEKQFWFNIFKNYSNYEIIVQQYNFSRLNSIKAAVKSKVIDVKSKKKILNNLNSEMSQSIMHFKNHLLSTPSNEIMQLKKSQLSNIRSRQPTHQIANSLLRSPATSNFSEIRKENDSLFSKNSNSNHSVTNKKFQSKFAQQQFQDNFQL